MNKVLLRLEKLASDLCPEDSQENPAFPNHTDKDIWVTGFVRGVQETMKAVIGTSDELSLDWFTRMIERSIEANKG